MGYHYHARIQSTVSSNIWRTHTVMADNDADALALLEDHYLAFNIDTPVLVSDDALEQYPLLR